MSITVYFDSANDLLKLVDAALRGTQLDDKTYNPPVNTARSIAEDLLTGLTDLKYMNVHPSVNDGDLYWPGWGVSIKAQEYSDLDDLEIDPDDQY